MNIDVLKMPPVKKKQFNKKGIYTIEDLLRYMPRKYYDFRTPKLIKDLIVGEFSAVIGTVEEVKDTSKVIKATIIDEHGQKMDILWFQKYVIKMLNIGEKYIFCGKVAVLPFPPYRKQMTNPMFSKNVSKYMKIYPVYSKIEGMSEDYLMQKIDEALAIAPKNEYLDLDTLLEFNLVRSYEMERMIHRPKTMEDIEKAKQRMIFDELFRFSMIMNYTYLSKDNTTKFIMKNADTIKPFLDTLPFKLTDGKNSQLSTVRDIYRKMRKGIRTNSLIQGDVGCGKTMVAILLMLIAAENRYQSAMMAPTMVLAQQHYEEICKRTAHLPDINVVFLHGDMKAKERKEKLEAIKNGQANIIVGTHAVISKEVEFKNLALTIVDEEHRFGVIQRKLLQEKAEQGVHHVTMSATPIPRSLALAIYGEGIDIYTIKVMPEGRKPIITTIETEIEKAYEFMYEEIKKGRQCYVVCPIIDESDSERLQNVESVEETYEQIKKFFEKRPEVQIGKISGKMSSAAIEQEISKFANNEYNILVSTTIIEVGVNVPNATVMLVKNAERFGLSQLHQLRGRVGRGEHQSYCILCSNKEDVERLKIMESTTDGFKIAEADLKLRGLGDFIGTKQTGYTKAVMLMIANPELYKKISEKTRFILKNDKDLKKYDFILNEYDVEKESERNEKLSKWEA